MGANRIRHWEFTDSPQPLVSKITETIRYPAAEDQAWIHNTHGQNVRIAELVARGLPPKISGWAGELLLQVGQAVTQGSG